MNVLKAFFARYTTAVLHNHPHCGSLEHRNWLVGELCREIPLSATFAIPAAMRRSPATFFDMIREHAKAAATAVAEGATRAGSPAADSAATLALLPAASPAAASAVIGHSALAPPASAASAADPAVIRHPGLAPSASAAPAAGPAVTRALAPPASAAPAADSAVNHGRRVRVVTQADKKAVACPAGTGTRYIKVIR